jgi:hypothetical protein
MARKKTLPRTKPRIERPIAVTIRGSEEWKAWVEAGAKFCRTDVTKLFDVAVVEYLKARGFDSEAPER